MTVKKLPLRRCLGCMQSFPKKELVRVVRGPDGSFSMDLTGKKNGRGAYLCKSFDCFQKCVKAKRLERAFSCQIPGDVLELLSRQLSSDG